MSELSKAYEPKAVEDKWYEFWQEQGCFTADPGRVSERRPAYSIVIPPPNVTGVLTMGHVLNNTIQDILARKARMDGREVLWLPGTDHAGIATQTVVERTLKKQGLIRHRDDLGRERFLDRVWEWKEKHGGIIIQQLKKLGASCDWSRTRFTMDPEYSRCVQRVFVDLYRKDQIYRGRRMVNWCPVSLTALSDEEVVMKQQSGLLYYFKVEVIEAPGTWLTIATTRPETIPGDTAVAVNPRDPRYAHLIGKHVRRPLPTEPQAPIPIIGDDHVDFEFGTGVLKVTPAHDKADFEIGERHQLPVIDILHPDGTLNELAGSTLAGLDRFKARKVAAEILDSLGLLVKQEPYSNNVGFSERADVPIEPRLSEQWFLRYPSLDASRACVANGTLRFHPDRWAKVYDHWMANIKDWCISRQLWWGHRIPVWRLPICAGPAHPSVRTIVDSLQSNPAGGTRTHSFSGLAGESSHCRLHVAGAGRLELEAATVSEAESRVLEAAGFAQDADVLDTWFSSWLWPFATMGWNGSDADRTNPTLRAFYPTTDLVTGPDIIFFWVARMIMAGYEYMGDLPFRNVYFTGIIRDKQGRKMSKSLGNSPDPLDLISQYGADALRFGVMRSAPLGQDILFDEQAVELGRNFCNKLWNACRFRQMQGGELEAEIDPALLGSDERWILSRLDLAVVEVTRAFADYRFSDATATLYRFFWSEYCDWFIEASKATLGFREDSQASAHPRRATTLAVIDLVLATTLRLFHPFLPFITEELWHGLGYAQDLPRDQGGRTLMTAPWPKPFSDDERRHLRLDPDSEAAAQLKYDLVTLGRNLRAQFNVPSNKRVPFLLRPSHPITPTDLEVIRLLLNASSLDVLAPATPTPKGTPQAANALGELHLPLEGLVDTSAERARLHKELEKIQAEIAKVTDKLANPTFTQKVPAKVLEEHRQRLVDWQTRETQTRAALEHLPPDPRSPG